MAENETLDLWDGRRWRKWLSMIESDEPAEEIAEEGKRCLVGMFKKLVGWIPLEEFLDSARHGDEIALGDIVRRCNKGRDYAELLKHQAALSADPERILEGFALAVTDGVLDRFEMKLFKDGRQREMVAFRTKRESLRRLMRDCAATLARKVADRPNEKPRMPDRSADQRERHQRDLLALSLRSGTDG